MVNKKVLDERESWETLLDQAMKYSERVKRQIPGHASTESYLNTIKLAEVKYLQAIAAMQIWDNCYQFQWIDAIAGLTNFYLWQGKNVEAIHLLGLVSNFYMKMKWDFEGMDGWTMLVELWLCVGHYEKAFELIEIIAERKNEYVKEKAASASEQGLDAQSEERRLKEKLNDDIDKLSPLIKAAAELKKRTESTKELTEKVLEPLATAIDKLVAENNGKLIDSFDELKKKNQQGRQLIEEAERNRIHAELQPLIKACLH